MTIRDKNGLELARGDWVQVTCQCYSGKIIVCKSPIIEITDEKFKTRQIAQGAILILLPSVPRITRVGDTNYLDRAMAEWEKRKEISEELVDSTMRLQFVPCWPWPRECIKFNPTENDLMVFNERSR